MTTNFRGYSQLVIDNLRREHGPALEKYTDQQIINVWADYNMSAKDESFLTWMEMETEYNKQEGIDNGK